MAHFRRVGRRDEWQWLRTRSRIALDERSHLLPGGQCVGQLQPDTCQSIQALLGQDDTTKANCQSGNFGAGDDDRGQGGQCDDSPDAWEEREE